MRKKFKSFFIIIIVLSIAIGGALLWFFVSNSAPAMYGDVIWSQEYKPGLELDIYLPTKQVFEKAPVVMYVHGGAWIGGSKGTVNINRFNGAFNNLREKGYAIIAPDYTLAAKDSSPFPNCIIDAYDALNWIESNADKYQFDLHNVGMLGESAGAHIALMSTYGKAEMFDAKASDGIKLNYIVDAYGPSSLEGIYKSSLADTLKAYLELLPENLEECLNVTEFLFGFDPEVDLYKSEAFMMKYSPVSYVNKDVPPTLMIHGKADRIVPVDQSLTLKSRLDGLGIENEIHLLNGADHGFRGATKEQKDSIQVWITDFILKNKK